MSRYWINAPSTLQPFHDLHGSCGTMKDGTFYTARGETLPDTPELRRFLSLGWPDHLEHPYVDPCHARAEALAYIDAVAPTGDNGFCSSLRTCLLSVVQFADMCKEHPGQTLLTNPDSIAIVEAFRKKVAASLPWPASIHY
jgi:hypothetical protein